MPGWFPGFLSGHKIERGWQAFGLLLALATLLEFAAGTGLAYVAGFGRVGVLLSQARWQWLLILPPAWAISYLGYYQGYSGVFRIGAGPVLPRRTLAAVALAGFGGFLACGSGSLDGYALRAAGASRAGARVKVASLAGLEQGALAIVGCGVAIVALTALRSAVSAGAALAWAVVPVPGFIVAFWLASRYRGHFGDSTGRRAVAGTLFESIHVLRGLFTHPVRWSPAIIGMAVFWAADAVAVWAGLETFGFGMNAVALFIGFASGMVFTRRTGPLAGAGVLALILPLTISYCGAPLAVAILGVFAYRIISLWLPVPLWLAVLPALRSLGESGALCPVQLPSLPSLPQILRPELSAETIV